MNSDEWLYHRERAIQVGSLGLCSLMRDGKLKIEGYEPMTEKQATNLPSVRMRIDYITALKALQ